MKGLIRAEALKVKSTWLWWGLLAGVIVWTAMNAGLTAGFSGMEPGAGQPATPGLDQDSAIRGVYATATFTGAYIFAMILGIASMTGEARYQTLTPTFLASPRRGRVVAAKMIAHLGYGLFFAMIAMFTALLVGGAVILIRGHDLGYDAADLWPSVGGAIAAVALWTLIGIGIGTLIRNQVVAILVAILFTFLIETLLTFGLDAVGAEDIPKFLPTNASSALTSPADNGFIDLLPAWGGGLVLLAYAAVFALAGMLLTLRRDVT